MSLANRVHNRRTADLAVVTGLSNRHADVRQARIDSGNLALGTSSLNRMFRVLGFEVSSTEALDRISKLET